MTECIRHHWHNEPELGPAYEHTCGATEENTRWIERCCNCGVIRPGYPGLLPAAPAPSPRRRYWFKV